MKQLISKFVIAISIATIFTGCGGGGGSTTPAATGPVASTLSFPLLSGFQTFSANGFTKTFTVSGNCSGSGTITSAPANVATTFEGSPALSSTRTLTASFTNCTPSSLAQSYTSYFNSSNYTPLGFNSVGVNYGVYLSPPTIPSTVTVGGTAIIGTETLYTDSTKALGDGRTDLSYVIEADTSTTAIVNLIAKEYNAAGTLVKWTRPSRQKSV